MSKKQIGNKVVSFVLLIAMLFSMAVNVSAAQTETLGDGKAKTVTVTMKEKFNIMQTSDGVNLNGYAWEYLTDTGIVGPAYCINWGLKNPASNKKLTIAGKYTANPKTIGAFASGYPQRSLEDFISLYSGDRPILANLTREEFASATQIAVWATLGQVAIQGTDFTTGRAMLMKPTSDLQQMRVYAAMEVILNNAKHWDRPLNTGMHFRLGRTEGGNVLNIEHKKGILGAEEDGVYGIKKEVINGIEYYTRPFVVSSATSTYKHGYCIEIWAENAPEGTIFTGLDNKELETVVWEGQKLWKVPTPQSEVTNMNENGSEYAGDFKICIPVRHAGDSGNIILRGTSTITQYAIYLANNTEDTEQSFVIADPLYTSMYCYGEMKWNKVASPYGRLVLNKSDGMGNALPGAIFELVGTDGSKFEGTSNSEGMIIWEYLNPDIQYTLTETQAPEGFLKAEPMTVSVPAGQTQTINVANKSARTLRVVKIDAQDGSPILGATFRFEQIDGSHKTDITTTHSGVIELTGSDLPYGTYKVFELKAPEGYQEDKEPQTVEWKGTEDITLTFENVRKPSLRIVKMDKNTHDPLEDVSFKVYKDGELVTTVTTDNAGYARASGLTEGYYEVEEVAAPEGYVLDTTRHGIHIDPYNPATENDPVLVITNEKKPGLVIEKLDSKTLEPMEGTTFAVYKDTVLIGEYKTDRYGLIELTDLEPGTYTVKEVKTDDSHVLQGCPQSIELVAGKEARLIFFNKEKPGISILKIDAETKKPLSNAVFKVKMVDGSYEKEYTTDKNGEIELTDLEPGVYMVTETTAPDGYVIDTETRTFEAVADGSVSLVFTNSKKPSLTVLKYDAYKDKYLAGATFRIAKIEDGSNYLDRVTDTNGAIRIDNLLPGVYSVKEIEAPSGYVLNDTEYHVELFGGKESQLVVINEEKPSLKIEKTDAITGEPIQGVGFLVKHAEGSTENTVVTDENGVAVLEHLAPGIYEVTEKSVPNGYLLDTEPKLVTLEPNRTSVVRFKNYPKPSLTINKVDEITKDALKGAKFSIIYASNNTFTGEINDMGSYQTDDKGQIKLYNLKDGWYKISETEAPDGYKIKEQAQEIYIKAGENKEITFENTPLSALVIKKVDAVSGKVLQGAKFRLRYFSGVSGTGGTVIGEYTTSANGTIVINRLKAGTYIVEETKAPDGYIINDAPETVYITGKEQDVITVEFENYADGGLIIRKLDSQTKQPLSGAEFKVTTASGELVGNQGGNVSSNGIYVTDASGQIHITGIEAGTTLVVTETKAPEGYVLDTLSQTVVINKSDTQTLTFYNKPDSGLVITKLDKKTGEPLYGAVFKVTTDEGTVVGNANGRYTTDRNGMIHIYDLPSDTYIITEIEAPSGYTLDSKPQTIKLKSGETHEVTFYNEAIGGIRITKVDEETRDVIKGAQFRVEYMNGERVGTYTTNSSGVINIDGLENGWYTIIETKAAKGYQLDSEPHDIEVKNGQIAKITITNRKTSSFLIHKVDSTTGRGIYGVTFLVSDRYGNPVAQYTSDHNGYVYMDDRDFDDGKYYIREIAVPNGYVIDTEVKTFYVEYGETSSITWYNTPTQAQIQIIKKSADYNQINGLPAGSLLEGATFEIYDRGGNIVDTIKTDKNGRAASKTLPLGLYTVRETIAPAYYSINETLMTANLEFSGQIVTFEVLDKSVSTGVSIIKRGYNEVMPNNPLVYTFTNIANTSSVPLNSFYWRDTLPSAIRTEKLVTGTYNQQLSYKIVYQTNLSNGEYRTINDNLSTSKNYALDISNAALGLAGNEYITEIMFVFGNVKAGFAQVETPYLYARSIAGLPNGASFVNQADVGGVYNGQWITSVSRWVTKVYNYTHFEMPRTGY